MHSLSFLSRSKLASCAVVLLGSFLSFPLTASAQASNPADDAVAYQVNAAHSGSISLQNFNTPLRRRWTVNLGRTVSYPLIADGRVFVTVGDSNSRWDTNAGSTSEKWLYALDAISGQTLWRKPIAGYYWRVNACYEAGRVFVSDDNGVLTAYDAATGNIVWSQKVSYWGLNPPTALNGIIYVDGYNSPGAVFSAVRASDGVILWRAYPGGGNCVMSAVTPEGVYASFGNYGTFKWDPITGAQRWRYNSGNWGTSAVFHSGMMFARGVDPVTSRGVALSAQGGALVRNFDASPAPAFAGDLGYFQVNGELQCQVVQTGAVLWRLRPPGQNSWGESAQFTTAPLIVNNYVFVGGSNQTLYALDRISGQIVWSDKVGISLFGPDEWNVARPVTGLNAGEGLLLIPADNTLIAYEPDVTDTQAPQTQAQVSGTQGTNGWYRSDVQVALSANDGNGGGVTSTFYTVNNGAAQTYSAPFNVPGDAQYSISYWSVDKAGNAETPKTLSLKIDATKPTLQWGEAQPSANTAGWNNTDVHVPFGTDDNLSGIASTNAASPLKFSTEGQNQTQSVTVTDQAGNNASFTSPKISIDLTAPQTSASVSGASGNNGWMRGPASVTLSPSDALSGVSTTKFSVDGGVAQTYNGAFTVSGDGQHTIRFWSVDAADNSEAARTRAVNIDAVAPMLSVSASPSRIVVAKKNPWVTVTVSGQVTDALSGVDGSLTYSVQDEYGEVQPSGTAMPTANGSYSFTVQLNAQFNRKDRGGRTYTITVRAADKAGNQVARSATVTAS